MKALAIGDYTSIVTNSKETKFCGYNDDTIKNILS